MPELVTSNEEQFGVFGVALALVTWFSGAAICILVGACAGVILAEDPGRIGKLVRGAESHTLADGARPPLPAPDHDMSLRTRSRAPTTRDHDLIHRPATPGGRFP